MEQMLSRSHVFWLLGAVLVVLLVYLIGPVLTPFFIALFIAYVSNPGVSYLEKAGVPRWASMLTGVVFVLVIVGLTSFLFLPTLKTQLSEYLDQIPSYLTQFRAWTDPYISKLTSVAAKVTDADQGSVGSVTDLAKTALPSGVGGQAGAATVDLAKTSTVVLIQVITNIFLIPVIAFYLLRDWNSITTNLKRVLPAAQRTRVVGLARKVDTVLKSFLYGQLLVVRPPSNYGFRVAQPLSCKAALCRPIVDKQGGHTSNKANAVRTTAVPLPSGVSVCARTRVALARRMPNMPSQERLVANADRHAEPAIRRWTDH